MSHPLNAHQRLSHQQIQEPYLRDAAMEANTQLGAAHHRQSTHAFSRTNQRIYSVHYCKTSTLPVGGREGVEGTVAGEGVERAHYQSTPNIGGFDPQLQVVFPPSANYMRLKSIIH